MTTSQKHAEKLKRFRRNSPKLFELYIQLPVYTPGMEVRCPTHNMDGTPIDDNDVKGCGSTHVGWDGDVYDCYDCGVFFSDYAAEPPHQRVEQDEPDDDCDDYPAFDANQLFSM